MVRKLRQNSDIEGGIYHIVCRGVNQRRIFRSSRDYNKFLSFLIETKKKFPFYLYSYNLLPNHVHLEIERRKVSLSKFMHYFNTCYSIYFNRRYKRSGHFFQDRFHSSLIDTESYFWQVSSYIDLNAVRAGLVEQPEDYPWSSFLIYAQKEYNGDLIDRDRFLRLGGEGAVEEFRQKYVKFVKEKMNEPYEKIPKFIENEKFI